MAVNFAPEIYEQILPEHRDSLNALGKGANIVKEAHNFPAY